MSRYTQTTLNIRLSTQEKDHFAKLAQRWRPSSQWRRTTLTDFVKHAIADWESRNPAPPQKT